LQVTSALEMQQALAERYDQAQVVIKAAAVADYRPTQKESQKIKKNTEELSLQLEKNPDLLAELGKNKKHQILVGFAAETENLLDNAASKLKRKNLDMIVANDVTAEGSGFGSETNLVNFLYADGRHEVLPLLSKKEVANRLLDRIAVLLAKSGG
jgi:phosphopantothenoylcysteine decarboxylase/phosphopantothenate--cysteine ligase